MVSSDESVGGTASSSASSSCSVLILDAGAQFGAVIDRRCREIGVESHVKPRGTKAEDIKVGRGHIASYCIRKTRRKQFKRETNSLNTGKCYFIPHSLFSVSWLPRIDPLRRSQVRVRRRRPMVRPRAVQPGPARTRNMLRNAGKKGKENSSIAISHNGLGCHSRF